MITCRCKPLCFRTGIRQLDDQSSTASVCSRLESTPLRHSAGVLGFYLSPGILRKQTDVMQLMIYRVPTVTRVCRSVLNLLLDLAYLSHYVEIDNDRNLSRVTFRWSKMVAGRTCSRLRSRVVRATKIGSIRPENSDWIMSIRVIASGVDCAFANLVAHFGHYWFSRSGAGDRLVMLAHSPTRLK